MCRTSQPASTTSDPLSELSCVVPSGNVHIAQRRVCVTQSSSRQVNIGHLCERLVVRSRMGNHQRAAWLPEAAGIWVVKVPGVKPPAIGVAAVAVANFSTARWPVLLDDMAPTSARFSVASMA